MKGEQNYKFQSLSPTKEYSKENEIYYQALKQAIDNDTNKDIAISGVYGSGKSSILKSFFTKNSEYSPIFISLGAFNIIEKKDIKVKEEDDDSLNEKNTFNQILEKSILQQLLYSVKETEVPLSRFKRISNIPDIKWNQWNNVLKYYLLIILLMATFIYFKSPTSISSNFKNIFEYKSMIFVGLISIFSCYLLIIKIYSYLKKYIKLTKIKIKEAEIELTTTNESIFNKYIDEILYFFEVTKYTILIVEDLDRNENIEFIFSKLKELNQIINNSKQVNKKITFIYAVRDDLFATFEERTKFFDFIIPILPISSNSNSSERINELFDELNDKSKRPSKNYIKDIHLYICDMRTIKNVFNEYLIYINRINLKYIDNDKLFSIILYKNVYPERFADLQQNKGNIYDAFKNKNKNISKCINDIENKINDLKKEINLAETEFITNSSELKRLFLYSYDKINENHKILGVKSSNNNYTIEEFLNNNFDFDSFLNGQITLQYSTRYNGELNLNEEQIFEDIKKIEFKRRYNVIKNRQENSVVIIKEHIDKLENEKKYNNNLKLYELIEKYGIEKFINVNNEEKNNFEKFLLKRGYIDELYTDYIDLFVEGGISKKDKDYILLIKNGYPSDENMYNYEFDNIDNVINELNIKDYESGLIYNKQIIDNLIDDPKKIKLIFNKLDSNIRNFIFKYDSLQKDNKFKKIILEKLPNIISEIINYNIISDKNWFIEFLNNSQLIKKLDEGSKKTIIEYFNNFEDNESIIEFNEDQIKTLKELGIKLEKYQGSYIEKIYKNGLYSLNFYMIKRILENNNIDITNFENKNYTIIMNSNLELLIKNIKSNFDNYFNNCFSSLIQQKDDIKLVLELLNDEDIDAETCNEILSKEDIIFTNILDIVYSELYDEIFKKNKILPHFENIYQLYLSKENQIDGILDNYISENVNIIMENSNPIDKASSTIQNNWKEDNEFKNSILLLDSINVENKKKIIKLFETTFEDIADISNQVNIGCKYAIAINNNIEESYYDIYIEILSSDIELNDKLVLLIDLLSSNLEYNMFFDAMGNEYKKLNINNGYKKLKLDYDVKNYNIIEILSRKFNTPISSSKIKDGKIEINLKRKINED